MDRVQKHLFEHHPIRLCCFKPLTFFYRYFLIILYVLFHQNPPNRHYGAIQII